MKIVMEKLLDHHLHVKSNAMDKTAHLIEMNMFDVQLAGVHD